MKEHKEHDSIGICFPPISQICLFVSSFPTDFQSAIVQEDEAHRWVKGGNRGYATFLDGCRWIISRGRAEKGALRMWLWLLLWLMLCGWWFMVNGSKWLLLVVHPPPTWGDQYASSVWTVSFQDRAMLAELKATWASKETAHQQRLEQRQKELLALQEHRKKGRQGGK